MNSLHYPFTEPYCYCYYRTPLDPSCTETRDLIPNAHTRTLQIPRTAAIFRDIILSALLANGRAVVKLGKDLGSQDC